MDSHGAKRATVDILARLGPGGSSFCSAHGVLVRSPFAPTSLAAAVSGRTVSLTWRDPADTTSVEVEYGLAPGHRLGALRVEPAGRTDIAGVPPGTYYVRVRALNEVGASPASNEVRVVVP